MPHFELSQPYRKSIRPDDDIDDIKSEDNGRLAVRAACHTVFINNRTNAEQGYLGRTVTVNQTDVISFARDILALSSLLLTSKWQQAAH